MKLSTGREAFPIEFDNGEKTTIYFNPADPELAVRLKDFSDSLQDRLKGLDDIETDANGEATEEKAVELIREITHFVKDGIDKVFASDISGEVFKFCSPLAIVGGDYFITQFMNGVAPKIEKEVKKAREKVNKNIEKHLKKYAK